MNIKLHLSKSVLRVISRYFQEQCLKALAKLSYLAFKLVIFRDNLLLQESCHFGQMFGHRFSFFFNLKFSEKENNQKMRFSRNEKRRGREY
jgi:hypothetical protein